MQPLVFAASSYFNSAPLIEGLRGRDEITVLEDVPSVILDYIRDGRADAGLLPIVDLFQNTGLEMIDGLGVCADGPVRSVILCANRPLDEVKTVAADPESRTSNLLAQLLLQTHLGSGAKVIRGASEKPCDASVVIGDRALTMYSSDSKNALGEMLPPSPRLRRTRRQAQHDSSARNTTTLSLSSRAKSRDLGLSNTSSTIAKMEWRTYDLAELWKEMTGLPFVFAVWVHRKHNENTRSLAKVLEESCKLGEAARESIAERFSRKLSLPLSLCRDYISSCVYYRVGDRERQAIRRFDRSLREHGLLEDDK